ncbi:endonuclease/exonuclease/phosphatase family protein [Micromonospora sp. LOL_013]|uniref:endonuclease/exonuclease/phosphatase family protein n=1 Tax=Micromonospora sp. LOL_013 TaxID=3345414 RepID=UPI003A8BEE3B
MSHLITAAGGAARTAAPPAAPGVPGVPGDGPAGGTADRGPGGPRHRGWPPRTRLVFATVAGWSLFLAVFLTLTGTQWWWRPFELMPPLLFVAVPLLLAPLTLLARPVRARLALVLVGCLVLGTDLAGLNVHALPGGRTAAPAPADAVRVFAWNTEYWHDGDDPERFYAYLADQRADVYLLSEHVGWDLAGHRPVRVDYRAELRERFPGYQIVAVGELLTMSRYPVVRHHGLDATPYLTDPGLGGPPPGSDFPDYYRYKVLRTDLLVGGTVFSAYNVHIPVQLDVSMDPRRAEFTAFMRAQEIRRQAHYRAVAADLAGNPAAVLLAGDFNATSAMGELRALGRRLRDALPASREIYPVSWPDGGTVLWRLDWAFTAGPARVHDYRMVPGWGMSDHRGQLVTVSVS